MTLKAYQPYSKQVLIGNWFDRRFVNDEKSSGILPGLSPPEGCEHHRTVNEDTYSGEVPKNTYEEQRLMRLRNYVASTASNVKLMDSLELCNNFATTNTLLYDWLPHQRKEILKTLTLDVPPKRLPHVDMLESFDNITRRDNCVQRMECEMELNKLNNMRSTYATSFRKYNCD